MSTVEIKSAVVPYVLFKLTVEDEQGNPLVKEYKLVYDYAAIRRAEEATGVDLKDVEGWKKSLKSFHTPALVHAGLARYHSEVPLTEIETYLHPGVQGQLLHAIFEMLFPTVADLRKIVEEQQKAGTSPNVGGPADGPEVAA